MTLVEFSSDRLAELRREADEAAHEIARLLPFLSDEELGQLARDIRDEGLLEPIITDAEGRIVDGRNRLVACRLVGVEPAFSAMPEASRAVTVAISRNIMRRHLSTAQRAALAAKLCTLKRGGKQPASSPDAVSQAEAAALTKVSARSVRAAARVMAADPVLHEYIEKDVLSTHAGEKLLALPAPERHAVLAEVKALPRPQRKARLGAALRSFKPRRDDTPADTPVPAVAPVIPAAYAALFTELDAIADYVVERPLTLPSARELRDKLARGAEILEEHIGRLERAEAADAPL